MCESAVFTVAAMSISMPLTGIWWSIYKMDVGKNGGKQEKKKKICKKN